MKKTKIDKVREHLKSGKALTPLEAMQLYGTMRLAAIVFVLREEGMNIETTTVQKGDSHYASYKLKSEPVQGSLGL